MDFEVYRQFHLSWISKKGNVGVGRLEKERGPQGEWGCGLREEKSLKLARNKGLGHTRVSFAHLDVARLSRAQLLSGV